MSRISIESEPDGNALRIDSAGQAFVRTDCSPRTVNTIRAAFTDQAVSTVVQADPGRCSLTIQVQGTNSFMVVLAAANPTSGDFLIGPGETFTFPLYDGEMRGIGVGGPGNFVAISAKRAN